MDRPQSQEFDKKPASEQTYEALHREIQGVLNARAKFRVVARMIGRSNSVQRKMDHTDSNLLQPQAAKGVSKQASTSTIGAISQAPSTTATTRSKACVIQ